MKTTLLSTLLLCWSIAVYAQYPQLEWAKRLGSTGDDDGMAIGVDSWGNIYTCGRFERTVDFDDGPGVANLSSNGDWDIFVTKYNAFGQFVWAKAMGNVADDRAYSIAVEPSGTFCIAGKFKGEVDFDSGPGKYELNGAGKENIFVAKYNADGAIQWAKQIDGTDYALAMKVYIDRKGNVLACGSFRENVDFDPGPGTFYLDSKYLYDVYVLKLNANGNFVWARQMGGAANNDFGYAVGTDDSGNIYSSGYFWGTGDFDPGPGTTLLSARGGTGGSDAFISKLDSNGTFKWVKQITNDVLDSPADETNTTMIVDQAGNCYLTGRFFGNTDFDPGAPLYRLSSKGLEDTYLLKLGPEGNFLWAAQIGGKSVDYGHSLCLDTSGNIYLSGSFSDKVDFDPVNGSSYFMTSYGQEDAYVLKLSKEGKFIWARQMGGAGNDAATGVFVNPKGNIYTTGYFQWTADFDPGAGSLNLTASGPYDIFIHKMTNNALGIADQWDQNNILLYPNPNNGQFTLRIPPDAHNIAIEVYNTTGMLIHRQNLDATVSTVDISGQVPGFYFVKILNEEGLLSVQKIIKH